MTPALEYTYMSTMASTLFIFLLSALSIFQTVRYKLAHPELAGNDYTNVERNSAYCVPRVGMTEY